jgi:hypothetical protein
MTQYNQKIRIAADRVGLPLYLATLHHPPLAGLPAEHGAVLRIGTCSHSWDAADPVHRAELQRLVDALKEVIAEGAHVQTTGERPPRGRCRCGVQRGTEHLRNCRDRCQDCSGDPDGPNRCRCRG